MAVESFWDDAKKPRQKFIKHLGSIKESELLKPSAYNEHINEIMKYIISERKGATVFMGSSLLKRDEFKQLIHTAFAKVGTRLDVHVGTMLEIMDTPTDDEEFTQKASKLYNVPIGIIRLASYIKDNGIPIVEEAVFNGKITLEEAFPIVFKPKENQEHLLSELLQSKGIGTRIVNNEI